MQMNEWIFQYTHMHTVILVLRETYSQKETWKCIIAQNLNLYPEHLEYHTFFNLSQKKLLGQTGWNWDLPILVYFNEVGALDALGGRIVLTTRPP